MGRRYGVAYDADIFVGKVLSDQGSGSDASILAGINWAMEQGCAVISMSLGANVAQVHPPYTVVGRRALDKGSLIIAAAGNNADRVNKKFGFVGPPANSPYIMAVGALTQQLNTAFFSARTLDINGGQVDVAGPGYQVYSSWPMPNRYQQESPHWWRRRPATAVGSCGRRSSRRATGCSRRPLTSDRASSSRHSKA